MHNAIVTELKEAESKRQHGWARFFFGRLIVSLAIKLRQARRTSVPHGVYTPVVHFEPGEHAILDRGLSVVVVKHQKDGFVWVYLERGSSTAQTKVHHTRLRKAP